MFIIRIEERGSTREVKAILLPSGKNRVGEISCRIVGEPSLAGAIGVHHVNFMVAIAVAALLLVVNR